MDSGITSAKSLMIRVVSYTLILTLVGLAACSRKPKTDKDQVSYAIGVQFGKSLHAQKLDLDPATVSRGIEDGLMDKKIELSDAEMQAAIMKMSEARQKEQKVQAEKNKAESDAFMEKNKTADGVKFTESGLQYKMTQEGDGPSPKPENIVVVNYKGTLIDGKEFDSSYKRGKPAEFPVKGVIPGWTEGLQLMKKGGKATFFIPPQLAYGDRPRQNIPANSALIFEVELVDIKDAPKPPAMPPMAGHPQMPGRKTTLGKVRKTSSESSPAESKQ